MDSDFELTIQDRIWNRACYRENQTELKCGDKALAALLLLHSAIMNGGLLDAVEVLDEKDIDAAVEGYKFYGFSAVRELVETALTAYREFSDDGQLGALEPVLDSQYQSIIHDDGDLIAAFERHYAENPADYALP